MLDIAAHALEETNRTVPFNSMGKIILAEGGEYREEFGGNCVRQARHATRIAVACGLDPSRITYGTGAQRPHWVTFMQDEGVHRDDIYMLDPYVLHMDPINVTEVLRRGCTVRPAYPVLPDGNSSLVVSRATGDRTFDVELWAARSHVNKRDSDGRHKKAHVYSYDLDRRTDDLPGDGYQLLAGLTQKNLEMGVLHYGDNGVTRIYMHPENGTYYIHPSGGERVDSTRHADRCMEELARVAGELRTNAFALMDFFARGRRAYLRRKPTEPLPARPSGGSNATMSV